ncbi:GH17600 [Drosophila grimshawi]|uniref:GH17600 n=1 Tax=Drosophila grimshawi TaxID=7222 RepID=B4JXB3_DROGR|nr:GH17600 [Drosophila grimshawi]
MVLDCQVGEWGAWSECDKSCGTGMMTRTRQILQAAQNGGKHCPSMLQKRGCQGYRCHGHRDKKILREMALLLPAALSRHRRVNDSDSKGDSRHNLRTRYRDSFKHIRDHEQLGNLQSTGALNWILRRIRGNQGIQGCHKLPPYNLMQEGDRITVRCDLEALVQDKEASASATGSNKLQGGRATTAPTTTTTTTTTRKYLTAEEGGGGDESSNNDDEENDEEDEEEEEQEQEPEQEPEHEEEEEEEETNEDDAQNMLEPETDAEAETETGSNENNYEYKRQRQSQSQSHRQRSATSKRSTNKSAPLSPLALQQQQQQQQQQLLLSHHCRGEGLSGRTTRWSALPAPSCRGKWLRLTIGPPKKCNHAQFIFV